MTQIGTRISTCPGVCIPMCIRTGRDDRYLVYEFDLTSSYESSEVRRVDLFITPGIEESFSALTQNFAFLPRKLMARFLAQNGSD